MDIKQKKVVIICDYGYYDGGAAKIAIDSAIGLNNHGYEVTFFCCVGPVEEKLKNGINRIICLNQFDILKNPSRIAAIFQGLYNKIAKNELDILLSKKEYKNCVVFIHSWTKALSSSIFSVCKKHDVETYLTLHDYFVICPNGGFYNYRKNNICHLKPLSLNCLVCNCDKRNYLQKIWRYIRQIIQNTNIKSFRKLKYIYISNFQKNIINEYIDLDMIYLQNPIESYPNNETNYVNNDTYIFIGRISEEKGIELFCKAISKINKKGIVVGDGDLKDELSKHYNNINFVGWKNKKEIYEYIKISRCVIFPSLVYETDGLTVKEATTAGIPCIVPDKCAASEQIIDGVNGYIFKTNNLDDLIYKIELLDKTKMNNYIKKQSSISDYINEISEIIG